MCSGIRKKTLDFSNYLKFQRLEIQLDPMIVHECRKRAKPGANHARLDAAKAKHRRRDFTFGDFARPGAVGRRPRSRA